MSRTAKWSVTLIVLGTICVQLISLDSSSKKMRAEDDMINTSIAAICTQMPHGTVKNGLAAFLLPACGNLRMSPDQPVPVLFGVIFVGRGGSPGEEMGIWPVLGPADSGNLSWFSVKDADGLDVDYRGPALDYAEPVFTQGDVVKVARNCFYGTIFELGEYYEFQQPGTYTVTWHYSASGRGAWQGELISNEIKIEFK